MAGHADEVADAVVQPYWHDLTVFCQFNMTGDVTRLHCLGILFVWIQGIESRIREYDEASA